MIAPVRRVWPAALFAAAIAIGSAEAATTLRIVPAEPERILAQKPTGPAQPQPGQRPAQPQQQPQQQPPQQQEPQDDEPARFEPLPTGAELDAFVQRAVRPALEGLRSFARHPTANGVYQVETTDQALPSFLVNLVEERNVIAPNEAVGHFQRGFGTCRDTQTVGERFDDAGMVMQSFTTTCRTQSGAEVQLFIIAGHDDQRTQVLAMMSAPQFAQALRARGELLVYEAMVSGG